MWKASSRKCLDPVFWKVHVRKQLYVERVKPLLVTDLSPPSTTVYRFYGSERLVLIALTRFLGEKYCTSQHSMPKLQGSTSNWTLGYGKCKSSHILSVGGVKRYRLKPRVQSRVNWGARECERKIICMVKKTPTVITHSMSIILYGMYCRCTCVLVSNQEKTFVTGTPEDSPRHAELWKMSGTERLQLTETQSSMGWWNQIWTSIQMWERGNCG